MWHCAASALHSAQLFLYTSELPITTSFGWTSPSATNSANGPVIAAFGTGTPLTSALSVGYLTNTTINSATFQPTLATVGTGTLNQGDLVSISNAGAGMIDLVDSGITLSSGKISTSSLTGVLSTSNGGTGTGSNFLAHQFFGNSGASSAAPAASLIGTSDTSVNWYSAGTGGSGSAQTVNLTQAATALTAGLEVHWLPTVANTSTAPTLTVNSLAAKPITKCGAALLAPGDYTTSAIARVVYDGTEFQLQNPQAQPCGTVAPLCAGALVTIPSSTTVYIAFGTNSLTETSAPLPVPVTGTAVSLHAWANAATPYSIAVQGRYNGANLTNLSCTISSGGTGCDSTTPWHQHSHRGLREQVGCSVGFWGRNVLINCL